MAVVKCPHCGKYISDTLEVCPECGASGASVPVKRNKTLPVILGVVAVVMLLCVSAIFLLSPVESSENSEAEAYVHLNGCTDVKRYEAFLKQFPDSEHAADVKKTLVQLKQDRMAYDRALTVGSILALQQFVVNCPKNLYVAECVSLIDSLEWMEAQKINTPESYLHYLKAHPVGRFSSQARQARTQTGKLQVSREDFGIIRGSLNTFLAAMSNYDSRSLTPLLAPGFSFGDSITASANDVLAFYINNFFGDDVIGVHFSIPDSFDVKKSTVTNEGQFVYDVNVNVEACFNRSSVSAPHSQQWSLKAQLTPQRKFTLVEMKQLPAN